MTSYSNNTRSCYFRIAGITVQLKSVIPLREDIFGAKLKLFEVDGAGTDTITVEHRFSLPDLNGHDMGQQVYSRAPWIIYKKGRVWIYILYSSANTWAPLRVFPRMWHRMRYGAQESRQGEESKEGYPSQPEKGVRIQLIALCSHDHTRLKIYNRNEDLFRRGNLTSLTLFPTDQILLAGVLAQRQGCFFHAGGIALEDQGFLFVGHAGAGKTMIVNMMKPIAEVLCDDRMIVRRWPEGFRAHGNWSHGDLEDISPNSCPLKGVFFLRKARENRINPLADKNEIIIKLLACLIKPFVTSDWWKSMLDLIEDIASQVPCYDLYFDKTGGIVPLLKEL